MIARVLLLMSNVLRFIRSHSNFLIPASYPVHTHSYILSLGLPWRSLAFTSIMAEV